ncbi:MAG: hypothetical protein CL912_20550 [Deltaproteobacteria bacterium]|nr:hypothetical protein [Deltaproteobacteria bacterium]
MTKRRIALTGLYQKIGRAPVEAFDRKGNMGMGIMWLSLMIIPSVTSKGQWSTFQGTPVVRFCSTGRVCAAIRDDSVSMQNA